MNPTCRRLMRYRTPCLMLCRYCVTDLRYPLGAPGLKGRHPSEKGCRSDKRSNHRCYEGQTQTGGNGSAHARASAALTCAMPQCMAQRYCVTLGMPQLAVDTGGRPHKPLGNVLSSEEDRKLAVFEPPYHRRPLPQRIELDHVSVTTSWPLTGTKQERPGLSKQKISGGFRSMQGAIVYAPKLSRYCCGLPLCVTGAYDGMEGQALLTN